MGFKVPDRIIILEGFTGDFEGLEVTCTKNAPLTVYMELDAAWSGGRRPDAYLLFGDEIIESWNLEDENGVPVPATGEALHTQPPDMAGLIVENWMRTVTEVPVPLEQPSTNGHAPSEREIEPPLDLGSMSIANS